MTEVIVVTSGKGGVGKTTSSGSLATGLAAEGHKTVVVDFDIGLRNLDLVMGCERRVVYDISNVLNGEACIKQALIKDKRYSNLSILAASQTRDKDILTKEGVSKIFQELKEEYEYIICDSPAGIERGALMAMYFADHAMVVTNPEISSVRDSDRILGILQSKTKRAEEGGAPVSEHLIITRYANKKVLSGDMLSIEDINELLGIPLLGVVPECRAVLKASNSGIPIILDPKSNAGKEYQNIVRRFLGTAPAYGDAKKKSFLKRLFNKSTEEVA